MAIDRQFPAELLKSGDDLSYKINECFNFENL
jgi:hypothetical protein